MSKPKPQEHADVIKAWAEGLPIQSKLRSMSGPWDDHTEPGMPAFCDPRLQWRVKHKWQKEIDAQAAGKLVQARDIGSNDQWVSASNWNFQSPDLEYRVAPEAVEYRLYLWKQVDGQHVVYVCSRDLLAAGNIQVHSGFVRWLGDWVTVEI